MDDSAGKGIDGKGLGDGENAENKAVKSQAAESATPEHKLPVVWSPKLDAAGDIEDDAFGFGAKELPQGEAAADGATTAAGSSPSRAGRFALLAASVSIAAAIGSFAATLALTGFNHTASVAAKSADAPDAKSLRAELAELGAIKSSLENANRSANAQFAAISQRLEKVEHTQIDPAQLAHISDTVDRLTRLNAAPETTGSIAAPSGAPSAAPATSTAPAETKITDRILEDWVVEDVHGNRALVASRYGGEFLVMPGSMLPGPGRVDAVKRQDGQWIVLTAKGTITEGAPLPR